MYDREKERKKESERGREREEEKVCMYCQKMQTKMSAVQLLGGYACHGTF